MSKLLVLKATPWKESDLLLRALSPVSGTGTYKLKYVHSKTQSRLSLAEPGNIVSVQLYTRTEIPVITEGKVLERFPHIFNTLTSLNYYWFCLFVLNTVVPADSLPVAEHQQLFKQVRHAIASYNEKLHALTIDEQSDPNNLVHKYPLALITYLYTFLDLSPALSIRFQAPQQTFDLLIKFIENSTGRRYHPIRL